MDTMMTSQRQMLQARLTNSPAKQPKGTLKAWPITNQRCRVCLTHHEEKPQPSTREVP